MIDSHLHVFPGFGPDDLVRHLDAEGIERCWLLTWEEVRPVPWPYVHLSLDSVLAAARQHPDRIVPMYAPDPWRSDAAERFRLAVDGGVRGCAELKSAVRWTDERMAPLLEVVDEMAMPLVFHMERGRTGYGPTGEGAAARQLHRVLNSERWAGVPRRLVEGAARLRGDWRRVLADARYDFPGYLMDFGGLESVLAHYRKIRFVGHGPFFWANIGADPGRASYPRGPVENAGAVDRLLRDYPNLWADLSGRSAYNALARDPAFARNFLRRHAGKLLYGTDNFQLGLRGFLERAELPTAARRRIFHDNAAALVTG